MLQADQSASVVINKPERDALEQVLRRPTKRLDEFERYHLESLLDKADKARVITQSNSGGDPEKGHPLVEDPRTGD